jgi:acetyltransferase-like isoleucine patch superfamily enzyme
VVNDVPAYAVVAGNPARAVMGTRGSVGDRTPQPERLRA